MKHTHSHKWKNETNEQNKTKNLYYCNIYFIYILSRQFHFREWVNGTKWRKNDPNKIMNKTKTKIVWCSLHEESLKRQKKKITPHTSKRCVLTVSVWRSTPTLHIWRWSWTFPLRHPNHLFLTTLIIKKRRNEKSVKAATTMAWHAGTRFHCLLL